MSVGPVSFVRCIGGGLVLALLAACAVTGVGYEGGGYGAPVGYVGGYYEPYGYDYGGWGGGRYRVGPPRGGDRGRSFGGGAPGGGRGAPSIPSRGRGH